MSLEIKITLEGDEQVARDLQAFRNALTRRGPMHARMAVAAKEVTQAHLRSDRSHNTASRLGAKPTGFRNKAAAKVEAQSDETEARVVMPANTGLGRAFRTVVIRPGSGRKYLTIPAHQRTYGRSVRDDRWGVDPFQFVLLGRFRALIFKDGPNKGEVAYWLKREVTQKQDRKLLPADVVYIKAARTAAVEYLENLPELRA
jgi:hypothetical protein